MNDVLNPAKYALGVAEMITQEMTALGLSLNDDERFKVEQAVFVAINSAKVRKEQA